MSFVQRSQRVGRRAHARASAIEITYRWVDGGPDVVMRLTPGLRRAEATNDAGVVVDRLINRWIGERSVFEAAKRLPKQGDRIFTAGGDAYVVTHPGGGREYELRDPYGESISINTVVAGLATGITPPVVITTPVIGSNGVAYGNGNGVAYYTGSTA